MSSSDKPKKDFAEMTESEIAMRKFLKALGVTTHQKLEQALADAVSQGGKKAAATAPDGRATPSKYTIGLLNSGKSIHPSPCHGSVDITANIDIPELGFSHQITATLTAPSETS